ncbi:predicted protein [Chaetomium globosum CBS 148.51]|uniref:Uncharacterized protein n=1 Tax=Chaetomium globosum (strain ATCC 6205 / CBS 148.51 / DSM 1962 / NBRC 6347 / NRRL 1970) TaxID=306901 RepID=Q2GNX9_CHAGB|nr:uncharacterized protein CHGG_10325 [Chaetomium globosum CBS 148.51]EAQ83921.1 predicted protein [Chaetomium globosum CBS 148.51]
MPSGAGGACCSGRRSAAAAVWRAQLPGRVLRTVGSVKDGRGGGRAGGAWGGVVGGGLEVGSHYSPHSSTKEPPRWYFHDASSCQGLWVNGLFT